MGEVLVLAYHAVSECWRADTLGDAGAVGVAARVPEYARGYRGATVHQAVSDPPADKAVAVTFDDGFRSVATFEYSDPPPVTASPAPSSYLRTSSEPMNQCGGPESTGGSAGVMKPSCFP